jgi:hypothetical protein
MPDITTTREQREEAARLLLSGLNADYIAAWVDTGEWQLARPTWDDWEYRYIRTATALAQRDARIAKMVPINCGQDGVVCATPPGCPRHWYEMNRERVNELAAAQARIAELIESIQQLGREHVRERANLQATIDGLINAAHAPGTIAVELGEACWTGQVWMRANWDEVLKRHIDPGKLYTATLLLKPEVG